MRSLLFLILFVVGSCASSSRSSVPSHCAMIVLGFPANDDGSPSKLMKYRLDKAISVLEKEKISYIIVTGGAVQNNYAEADVMKEYLIQKGIPKDIIIAETRAKSTFGNAYYSSRIIRNLNVYNAVIVTSEEHEERAGRIFSFFIPSHRFPD